MSSVSSWHLWVSVVLLQGKQSALCPLASTITQQRQLRGSCYPSRQWCDTMCLLTLVLAASCSHLEAACVTEGGSSKENKTAAHWPMLLVFPKANCRNSCTCKSPVSVETLKAGEGHACRMQLEKRFCSIGVGNFVGGVFQNLRIFLRFNSNTSTLRGSHL